MNGQAMSSLLHIADGRGRQAVITVDASDGALQQRLGVTGISKLISAFEITVDATFDKTVKNNVVKCPTAPQFANSQQVVHNSRKFVIERNGFMDWLHKLGSDK